MKNLNIFSSEKDYNDNISKLTPPSVSLVQEGKKIHFLKAHSPKPYIPPVTPVPPSPPIPPPPIEPIKTKYVDGDGLYQIGWSIDEIMEFDDYVGINKLWTEEEKQNHLVPEEDKQLMPMSIEKAKKVKKYCPKFEITGALEKIIEDDWGYEYYYSGAIFDGNRTIEALPKMDLTGTNDASFLFRQCQNLIYAPIINTGNISYMEGTFLACKSMKRIPDINTSGAVSMPYFFWGCENLEIFPKIDTSHNTCFRNFFEECFKMRVAPTYDTSSATDMSYMFKSCKLLENGPVLDTSGVKDFDEMFVDCINLKSVPNYDFSNMTSCRLMFYGCTSLITAPSLDFSNIDEAPSVFYNCTSLETVPFIPTPADRLLNVGAFTSFFTNCTSLKNFGGFGNLSESVNFSSCPLTKESAENVLRNLYDLTKYGPYFKKTITFKTGTMSGLDQKLINDVKTKGWNIVEG